MSPWKIPTPTVPHCFLESYVIQSDTSSTIQAEREDGRMQKVQPTAQTYLEKHPVDRLPEMTVVLRSEGVSRVKIQCIWRTRPTAACQQYIQSYRRKQPGWVSSATGIYSSVCPKLDVPSRIKTSSHNRQTTLPTAFIFPPQT